MANFQAKRIIKEYTHTVEAAPPKVFPLLCPVLEYDWIEQWTCEMIYTESGVAENNCVFKTNLPSRGQATWIVTNYEPENFVIGFAIFNDNGFVEKLDISLAEKAAGLTEATWTRTYTGLSQEGNDFITQFADETFAEMMQWLEKSLNHYCTTGEMLRK